MRICIVSTLFLLATSVVQAQSDAPEWNAPHAANPFIPGYFADPTIRKFGDIYYLYATTDGTGNGYGPAQVWMSYDFTNWRNMVMNWPTTEVVWAPDVVSQPDGSYRYYYCEPCNIIVGESTSPVGPWRNILGKDDAVLVPDRYVHNAITLDPQLFRDDNGEEYLYFTTWGIYDGFGCGVAKLNPHFVSSPTTQQTSDRHKNHDGDARRWREEAPFPIAADSFFVEKRLIPNTELKDIFEAPFVFKRNGIYYFTYSSGSCHDHTYRVQYATSTVGPMGPFEYKGCILQTNADGTIHGPGHHSVLQEGDRFYIVYHRHNNPHSAHGFNRQICIDEMKFDTDGNILPVVPTHDAQNVSLIVPQKFRNLAYGCQVTASSYYDEWFEPRYAVDDNNGTLWKASGTNWGQGGRESKKEWIQIDLGKAVTFNEVWTQFEYATFFYQYKIETSLDGRRWSLYADRTDNTMQGSPMIDRKSVKSRYLRITITDTQKNGHIPAIWNVKVWQEAPPLPPIKTDTNKGYRGMHLKDVSITERQHSHLSTLIVDAQEMGRGKTIPLDIKEVNTPTGTTFVANTPIRLRVKDGRWAFFLNGSQSLTSTTPLSRHYSYNSPYTISVWALQTEESPMATIVSLSSSHADFGTTEFRLGTDPQSGLINHNGTYENSGHTEAVKLAVGHWHHWVVTFDGWMERIYLDGELLHERNNFIMVRPEGHVVIGADGRSGNPFRGYLNQVRIMAHSMTADEVKKLYNHTKDSREPSLGDDFDESDPDSRFTLTPDMKPIYQHPEEMTLSASTGDFNASPTTQGGHIYKEVTGDFVVMCRFEDMEGYTDHHVKAYNEVGLLIKGANDTYYHLGVFPLYNCGNMLTVLSPQGRPQHPNYKGYNADPIMQFERRGHLLFARTSSDGDTWRNMPGSPIEIDESTLGIGVYQTTYTDTPSWAKLRDFVIYQAP